MFEESDRVDDEFAASMLPPLPKIVVLDFSLVSGMDGSAVDVRFVSKKVLDHYIVFLHTYFVVFDYR